MVQAQGHGGETQPNPLLFQSEELQLMPFLYLVSLKILFEESPQKLVFLVVLFCFVLFESTGLDSIMLGKLIKNVKM